jgi:hypothetical protein
MTFFGSSLLLQDHLYRLARALVSTHAAALAVVQVRNKEDLILGQRADLIWFVSIFEQSVDIFAGDLVDAALGAKDLTEVAFDAFLMVDHGNECPPGTGFGDLGAARIYQFACFYLHQETLS